MKQRYRIVLIIMAIMLSFSFCACDNRSANSDDDNEYSYVDSQTSSKQNSSIQASASKSNSVKESANNFVSINSSSNNLTSVSTSKSISVPEPIFKDGGINYVESTDIIQNPGRGFYFYMSEQLKKNSDVALVSVDDFNQVLDKTKNYTEESQYYIFLKIGLNDFSSAMGGNDEDISAKALLSLKRTLDNLRSSKMSATLRFAYDPSGESYSAKKDCEPKTITQIVKHVQQLAEVINDYRDCVYSVDAGMFGAWGEMHSTSYSDVYLSGTALEKVKDSLYLLIDSWLEATEGKMNIAVRRPRHYVIWYNKKFNTNYQYTQIATIPEKGFGSKISIYNDGYLNGAGDDGTYVDRSSEISWLKNRAFTSFGGETNKNAETSRGKYIAVEGFKTHTAYLNYCYHQEVIVSNTSNTAWKQQKYGVGMTDFDQIYKNETYYTYISNHLGYRLVLRESKLYESVKRGALLKVKGKVENVGFGNFTAKKKTYIVLEKGTTVIYIPTDFDAQKTFVMGINNYEIGVNIPSSISEGNYKVYMKIASEYDLSQTEVNRQIRFANADSQIFSEKLGANYLGEINIAL